MNEATTFGARLKQAREDKGMSRTALAQIIGTTPQAVSLYENEHNKPAMDTAILIAKALDVSLDWLADVDGTAAMSTVAIARILERLIEVPGICITEGTCDDNKESCPALVFTEECKLTQYMWELKAMQTIKTFGRGEKMYAEWMGQKLKELAGTEDKGHGHQSI